MKKKKFNKVKEIKAIARERVGKIPAKKIIKPKTKPTRAQILALARILEDAHSRLSSD